MHAAAGSVRHLRVIANRPVVEDEHSPYHVPPSEDFMRRCLYYVVVGVLLMLAMALILARLQ